MKTTTFFKVLTHDLRPPLQGGAPLFKEGQIPFKLPKVLVDKSSKECSFGWNACRTPEQALHITSLWPDGHLARLFKVEVEDDLIVERGNKVRFPSGTLTEEITDLTEVLNKLHEPLGDIQEDLTQEVLKWIEALKRPNQDPDSVEACLQEALKARGLQGWKLERYRSIDAMHDCRIRNINRHLSTDMRPTWQAWESHATSVARQAWESVNICHPPKHLGGLKGDLLGIWSGTNVWPALMFWVAARKGWLEEGTPCWDPMLLTTGLRDAYRNGLDLVLPIRTKTLGWVMKG